MGLCGDYPGNADVILRYALSALSFLGGEKEKALRSKVFILPPKKLKAPKGHFSISGYAPPAAKYPASGQYTPFLVQSPNLAIEFLAFRASYTGRVSPVC